MLIILRNTALSLALLTVAVAVASADAEKNTVLTPQYFGIHVHQPKQKSLWRGVGFGAIRFHDNNVSWRDLEPARDDWRWQRLDSLVDSAAEGKVDVLLTLESTPEWAASAPKMPAAYGSGANSMPIDINMWGQYVDTVVQRYRGRIGYYQVWNEPNVPKFFSGGPSDLYELTRRTKSLLRKLDPQAKLVCPSPTGENGLPFFRRLLETGIAAHCDIIGYHFYTGHRPPEAMLNVIAQVARLRDKYAPKTPIWNTETGWLVASRQTNASAVGFADDTKSLSADEIYSYYVRATLLASSAGVDRFYWYAWDNASMGLSAERGAGHSRASKAVIDYLATVRNSKMHGCQSESAVWKCQLTLRNGRQAQVLWTESGESIVSAGFAGDLFDFFQGGGAPLAHVARGKDINISGHPVFLVSSS